MTADELGVLAQVHEDAAAFFRQQLQARGAGAAAARSLLRTRAVSSEAAEGYELGYAPPGWMLLSKHLQALGHPEERLIAAGVSLHSRHGTLLDRFRNRLIFPVHHPSGSHVIAFLGRLVHEAATVPRSPSRPTQPGQVEPKYLNSPHTASYRKAEVLYGLGAAPARHALARDARPVLVEGPLDAIAVTCSATDRTGRPDYVGVAPCGTALTPGQVAALHSYAGPLQLRGIGTAFDQDPAGRQAAVRAFALLRAAGAWPTAAVLPPDLDPADVVATQGPGALDAALQQAAPLADLVVDAELDGWADQLRWAVGRVGAVRAAAGILAGLPPEHVGRQVHRVALRLGLEHATVTAVLLDTLGGDPSRHQPRLARRPASARPLVPARSNVRTGAARLAHASYPNGVRTRQAPDGPATGTRPDATGPVLSTTLRRAATAPSGTPHREARQ